LLGHNSDNDDESPYSMSLSQKISPESCIDSERSLWPHIYNASKRAKQVKHLTFETYESSLNTVTQASSLRKQTYEEQVSLLNVSTTMSHTHTQIPLNTGNQTYAPCRW